MIHEVVAQIDSWISALQTLLYIDVVQPLLFKFGLMGFDEETYDALYWVIIGVLQIAVTYALLRPLEALRPVEAWTDRKAVRVDIVYTWISKLGIVELGFFFVLQPFFDRLHSLMAIHGIPSLDLDNAWPGFTDRPLVAFVIYLGSSQKTENKAR